MTKSITFDRLTKDFRAEVDGVLIGFFGSRTAAQVACDEYVFEQLSH